MATNVFGIDLGTSNSAISYLDPLGVPQIKENSAGKQTTPSVVWFENGSNIIVGEVAKEEKLFSPDAVVDLIKRDMGTDRTRNFFGKQFTPESISALTLRSLAALVEDGPGKIPAVITIPAYFGAKEREATRNAGEIANLEVLNLIQEPVAAAIFYDSLHPLDGKNILVYDLGGGTFDVTAVHGSDSTFSIIATDGDANLGGEDWDHALEEFVLDLFVDATGDEAAEHDAAFRAKLRETIVSSKEKLSTAESTKIRLISDTGGKAKLTITREDFERITEPLLQRTEDCLNRVVETVEKKTPGATFDDVILVGGSSRMPAVADMLYNITGIDPQMVEPDLAVSKGAALFAAMSYLNGDGGSGSTAGDQGSVSEFAEKSGIDADALAGLAGKTVNNALPKSIGFYVLDHRDEPYIDFVVDQNTTIPLAEPAHRVYETTSNNQVAVNLSLYQQASDIPSVKVEMNEPISGSQGVKIEGIPAAPRGEKIEVSVHVAGDGLISFTGRHIRSGRSINAKVRIGVMSEEEVDSAKNALRGMRVSSSES